MYYMVKIGENIKILRNAAGFSQEKLAEHAGICAAWLREIEHDCANVTRDVLERLAKALNVPVWVFYTLKLDPEVVQSKLKAVQARPGLCWRDGPGIRRKDKVSAEYALLNCLGLTANCAGFFHTAYALALCTEEPGRLRSITKRLYPDVARQYKTSYNAVERNIRTAGLVIWRRKRLLLEELAQHILIDKPCNAQLLAILSTSLTHL